MPWARHLFQNKYPQSYFCSFLFIKQQYCTSSTYLSNTAVTQSIRNSLGNQRPMYCFSVGHLLEMSTADSSFAHEGALVSCLIVIFFDVHTLSLQISCLPISKPAAEIQSFSLLLFCCNFAPWLCCSLLCSDSPLLSIWF